MIRIHTLRQSETTVRQVDRAELAALLADEGAYVWVDLERPAAGETSILDDPLRLHPLVVENCREPSSSARIQEFEDYLFLTAHEAHLPKDATTKTITSIELDVVLGKRFLVTVHDEPLDCVEQVREMLGRGPRLLARGPAFLLYELFDRLVEAYLPVMDRIDDEIEQLEDRVMGKAGREDLEAVLTLKRTLQRIRRASARHKEILLVLSRDDVEIIPDEMQIYFRNVHDHLARVADLAESYRDLLSGVLDAYLSTTSNRLNEVMKVLTVIATIMMPMTCIAGVYGMNFDTSQPLNMPELRSPYGYLMALGLMALVGGGMLLFFRLRKWL